jgi:hypothetical protein
MRLPRVWCSTLVVGMAVAVSGCADSPATGPAPEKPLVSIGDFIKIFDGIAALVDSCASLPSTTVSQTIGREGGTIAIGPDTLRIPPGALHKPVTIEAALPAGYFVNVVTFRPDGLRFHKPASLTMGYSNCSIYGGNLKIAQVTDDLQIIGYLPSTNNRKNKTVSGRLEHFSNYAVAW